MDISKSEFDEIIDKTGASRRKVLAALSSMGVAGVASGTAAAASSSDRLRSADEFDIGLSVSKMASSEAATAVDRLLDARSITSIQSFLESHGLRLNTDDVTGKQVSTEQGSFKSYDVSVVGTDGDVTVFD